MQRTILSIKYPKSDVNGWKFSLALFVKGGQKLPYQSCILIFRFLSSKLKIEHFNNRNEVYHYV